MRNWVLLTALVCLLCTSIFAQENNPLINSGEIIKEGIKLHDAGKFKDAIALYKKVSRNDTNYVYALYELALSYGADSQHLESIKVCEEAFRQDFDHERHPELYTQYGSMIDDAGNPDKALLVFDTAINKYPSVARLLLNKGVTLMKLNRLKEAEAIFQKAIVIDPYSASSHYRLGQVAVAQGKIVPGFMSFVGYLIMNPSGGYYGNAINYLSSIASGKDMEKVLQERTSADIDQSIQDIEEIILSKIALNKSYKPILQLDDPISRQIQVLSEKMEYDPQSKDFYVQYYTPMFQKILKEKNFEGFINYIFSNVQIEQIQNYNKKNKKELQAAINSLSEYFSELRATREIIFAKRKDVKNRFLYENNRLSGKGVIKDDGKTYMGAWEFYYTDGNLMSKGNFNDRGEKEGPWEYYYFNGKMQIKQQLKNDKLFGESVKYYPNGNINSQFLYDNDEAEGAGYLYYESGVPRVILNYKKGLRHGVRKEYYDDGMLKSVETYSGDTLHGLYQTYYQNGQLDVTATYERGLINGPVKSYHTNGQLAFEGSYLKNNMNGAWKRFHDNGNPKSIENYVNGKAEGEYLEYHENGKPYLKQVFKKGEIIGEVNYQSENGKTFSTYVFDDGRLKSARYYDSTGKEIFSGDLKSKKLDLTMYDAYGTKLSQRVYNEKSIQVGTTTLFYPSGAISETNPYVDGEISGVSTSYHENGQKSAETHFDKGTMSGYHKKFTVNGIVQKEGWYQDGLMEGVWIYRDNMGRLQNKINSVNDYMHGYKEDYAPDGKKLAEIKYKEGIITEYRQFDSLGKVIQFISFPTASGRFSYKHWNGQTAAEVQMVKGHFEGAYPSYYFDGSPSVVQYYTRGAQDSVYKSFYYGGSVQMEGKFKDGRKEGIWKAYHENGKPYSVEEYKLDEIDGKATYYFYDGQKELERTYKEGLREGWSYKYALDGKLAYALLYRHGLQIGYSYHDKNGQLVPMIPIQKQTASVKTFYDNGKPSAEFQLLNGKVNGIDKLYHSNGQLWMESTDVIGMTNGLLKEYHPNGKLKKEITYYFGNQEGPFKELDQNGILIREGTFVNGDYHGTLKYYLPTGKLKEQHEYYYGTLLSVKK